MEFEYEWLTLGRHRIRLRSTKGFPTEKMRTAVEVIRLAIDSNMSARARLVEVVFRQESSYEIAVGTTFADDRLCAPQLEAAIADGPRPAARADQYFRDGSHSGRGQSALRCLREDAG